MTVFQGTSGHDDFPGSTGDDKFVLKAGGDDTATGLQGNDIFDMGHAFSAGDKLDGGDGIDEVSCRGSTSFVFAADTMVNVETLRLLGAFSYDFAVDDATVAAGERLKVNASHVDAPGFVRFNGTAETDGAFTFSGSAGDDGLAGGAGNDKFDLRRGGNDATDGGDGNDRFIMGGAFTAADAINGGDGRDVMFLDGDYGAGIAFTGTTLVGVEEIRLHDGHDYTILTAPDVRYALVVDGSALSRGHRLVFDGSSPANSNFDIIGGADRDGITGGLFVDTIHAGRGDDILAGDGNVDELYGGRGADVFQYFDVSESTSYAHDNIYDFDAAEDRFDTTATVESVGETQHEINFATFDQDLADAVGAGLTGAALVTATSGDYLTGHTFLLIDNNGDSHYSATFDYVIDITGYTGIITTANFI